MDLNLHNQGEDDLRSITSEVLNPSSRNLNVAYIEKDGL